MTTLFWVLPITDIVVLILLLWIVVYLKGKWWIKFAITLLCFGLVITQIYCLSSVLGSPRPKEFANTLSGLEGYLYAEVPDEPDNIFILFLKDGDKAPILYTVPYTRAEAKHAEKVNYRAMVGAIMHVKFAQGMGNVSSASATGASDSNWYELPPSHQPSKPMEPTE